MAKTHYPTETNLNAMQKRNAHQHTHTLSQQRQSGPSSTHALPSCGAPCEAPTALSLRRLSSWPSAPGPALSSHGHLTVQLPIVADFSQHFAISKFPDLAACSRLRVGLGCWLGFGISPPTWTYKCARQSAPLPLPLFSQVQGQQPVH